MSTLCEIVEKAIDKVVADFQNDPERFWNERDIHWSLFHYIKQENPVEEAYPTELIRAEFPTRKVFGDAKRARGHYDLVILNKESYQNPEVQGMKAQASWDDYLRLIQVDVAIEIKLWLYQLQNKDMEKGISWDIKKLTEEENGVKNAYFLNFVQLTHKHMKDYCEKLRNYLIVQKNKYPSLNILCVPSDTSIIHKSDNWL